MIRRNKVLKAALSIAVAGFLLTGCSQGGNQLSIGQTSQSARESQQALASDEVASINGQKITNEDLNFYSCLSRIQIETKRTDDRKNLQGAQLEAVMKNWDTAEKTALDHNTVLTQIIRLHAVDLLAKEKGYTVTPQDAGKQLAADKANFQTYSVVQGLIKQYGEQKFWDQYQNWLQLQIQSKKVQADVIELAKKDNPNATSKEINYTASKNYEDLVVSQMGTLKIAIAK